MILWVSVLTRNPTQQEGFLGHRYQEAQHPVQMQRLPSGPKTWLVEEKVTGLKIYHYMIWEKLLDRLNVAGRRLRVNNSDAKTNNQAWAGIFWLIWSEFCAISSPTSFVIKVLCDNFHAPRSRWHARMVTSIVTTGPKMTNARRILNGIFQMSHCPICLSLLKLWYYYTKAYYFNQVKLFSSCGSTIVYFFHFPF